MDGPGLDAPDTGDNDIEQLLADWRRTDERWGGSARARQAAAGVVRFYPGGALETNDEMLAQIRGTLTWRVGTVVLAPIRGVRRLVSRGKAQ